MNYLLKRKSRIRFSVLAGLLIITAASCRINPFVGYHEARLEIHPCAALDRDSHFVDIAESRLYGKAYLLRYKQYSYKPARLGFTITPPFSIDKQLNFTCKIIKNDTLIYPERGATQIREDAKHLTLLFDILEVNKTLESLVGSTVDLNFYQGITLEGKLSFCY